jgi:hypothetical protein
MTGIDSEKFNKPENLSEDGVKAYDTIMKLLKAEDAERHFKIDSGGCTTFYGPKQWKERGERYGAESLLIVCHDGGDMASYFDYDCEDYKAIDRMRKALYEVGLFAECCTGWYTAIYKI